MKFRITRVDGDEDADALLHMQKECLPEDRPLDPGEGEWWIATVDTYGVDGADVRSAGFACIKQSEQYIDMGYLARAGVLKDFRGHGLQRKLIQVRVNFARRHGWTAVWSDTRQNAHSANNLIACGFRMIIPKKPWGHADACYWIKYITRKEHEKTAEGNRPILASDAVREDDCS